MILRANETTSQTPLRVWPGVVLAALLCLMWFVLPQVLSDQGFYWFLGTAVAALAIFVWWAFFSRAHWAERLGAFVLIAVGLYVTRPFLHPSIKGAGMGMAFTIYAVLLMSLVLVAWAVASGRFAAGPRRVTMAATILLACAGWTLIRTGGVSGGGGWEFHWRWTPTPEDLLLAQASDKPALTPVASSPTPAAVETPKERPATKVEGKPPAVTAATPAATKPEAEWPGFRGPHRDGVVAGVSVKTDWSASPPVELWRRPVGPGWSSFAVRGDMLYTQEQRGENEVVTCYNLNTGKPVWEHRDAVRFWESNGGAGPRGTPTVSGGRVYAFGATGLLNALDAGTGAVVWSRNAAKDADVQTPYWGFAGSPLVVNDLVILAASGRLIAYDLATGNLRWLGEKAGGSYSSPHLLTIDGIAQVVLLSGTGATSVAPADGKMLWKHDWEGAIMLQPAMTADGEILITASDMAGGVGTRRLAVTHAPSGWTVLERWTTRGLKPYFNDFVVHKDHAYGFDGSILACIDLKDGNRKWKGGRYGNGQLLLLSDQGLLLVLSEEGELALVAAAPDQFKELARFPAIEGKTWNHPALVRDLLLVRNGQEMVAFRLSLARG